MYFWQVGSLAHAIAHERVSQKTAFLHCFFTLLYVGAGLVGASFFPAIYTWAIEQLNLFTSSYVNHGRPIALFNEYNAYLDVAVYMNIVVSFWYCFYVNQHADRHEFLARFWTLSWPVLVRATVYTLLIGSFFCLLPFLLFYLIKLLLIALMAIKTTPAWLLKIYTNVEQGGLSTSLAQLRLIKQLALTMNYLSWYVYVASGAFSLIQIMLFTHIMRKQLRLIAQLKKEITA